MKQSRSKLLNFLKKLDKRSSNKCGSSQTLKIDLSRANLTGVNLSNKNFTQANLSDIDLTNANLQGINFIWTDLNGAILTAANLQCAYLPK